MTAATISSSTDENATRRVVGAHLTVAIASMALGSLFGFLQALNYAGLDLYPAINQLLPGDLTLNYYQGLTGHGVLMVLVYTTFFICGFLVYVMRQALNRPLWNLRLEWAAFWLMLVGLIMAALPILANEATVMFTFYPPLKANVFFYLGLTLVVVGTWIVAFDLWQTFRAWQNANPGEKSPLPAFMSIVTMLMWVICSVGIAVQMLFQVLPWSIGLIPAIDPLASRTLFWYTGHAIVYFWLLPAYISWYTILPRQSGGKIFSDTMARISFLFFLGYSIPVGVHHQYTDPAISELIKLLHAAFTFVVFFPSLLTAFAVCASLESVGWAKGSTTLFGWVKHLPWRNPSVAAQVCAMLVFIFGGIGGLINASFNMNVLVHNTAWIVGHFHLTVGTGVALTFIGITYWLVPVLSGRQLWSDAMARWQVWCWVIGIVFFSATLHYLGVEGLPRRTNVGQAPYLTTTMRAWLPLVGIGGTLMFVSLVLYFVNMAMTAWKAPKLEVLFPGFGDFLHGPAATPRVFDRLAPWLAVSIALILIAYVPVIVEYFRNPPPGVPGMRVW